ncbi:hypothetical protein BSF38_05311 [Paludisphaera borealis]|uniref:Uncharacterized protein n=1 Tax=Paludisphaera borealis TaxID=1387353 RepID=A0A1U7CXS5_9BACT|nr:hypothetical protein BSF38_05311 [Paludisphaera borealis]
MIMTQPSTSRPRRIRAALIGFGFDGADDQQRVTRSAQCLVVGGSPETHDELREAMTRLEIELDEMQQDLGDLNPDELAELAFRIDLPELHHIAVRLDAGLDLQGREFEDLTVEELTALLSFEDTGATVET